MHLKFIHYLKNFRIYPLVIKRNFVFEIIEKEEEQNEVHDSYFILGTPKNQEKLNLTLKSIFL